MKQRAISILIAITLPFAGCATSSKDIVANAVSPMMYANYDCAQIGAELSRIQGQITATGGKLDQAASNDAALTTVGVVLFFPTLFFLGGTKAQEAEYAQLRGEFNALEKSAIEKRCSGAIPNPKVSVPVTTP